MPGSLDVEHLVRRHPGTLFRILPPMSYCGEIQILQIMRLGISSTLPLIAIDEVGRKVKFHSNRKVDLV